MVQCERGEPVADKAGKNVSDTGQNDPTQLLRDGMYVGTDKDAVRTWRLRELADTIYLWSNVSQDDIENKLARAVELYEDLKPANGLEGMLAIQMVGTHEAATECLRRAALRDQTSQGRDLALKHAAKLMELYLKQVAALDKHRGKGQQKVTVEHVHVAAGGQAIVGNVEAGSRALSSTRNAAPIAHQAEVPLDVSTEKVPNRRRKPKAE
jgi:hypothetical protein